MKCIYIKNKKSQNLIKININKCSDINLYIYLLHKKWSSFKICLLTASSKHNFKGRSVFTCSAKALCRDFDSSVQRFVASLKAAKTRINAVEQPDSEMKHLVNRFYNFVLALRIIERT